MDFKKTSSQTIIRIILLTLTLWLMVETFRGDSFLLLQLLFFGLAIYQTVSLIKFTNKTREEVAGFFKNIEFDELSVNYKPSEDPAIDSLHMEFNKVMEKLRNAGTGKEDDFQFMNNIVQHVGIGLMTFNDQGEVQIMNTAAKRLLKTDRLSNIEELKEISEKLVGTLFRLRTGGRELIRLEIGEDIVQLAIYAIQLTRRGEEYKLVSLQNIQNELEEKEMEAWQNLVRVLTHEIMNSVTPITSLATTVETELLERTGEEEEATIPKEELEDISLAIKTIKKRSIGLTRFVQDFRNLTQVPKPKISEVSVRELLEETVVLLHQEIEINKVVVTIITEPLGMVIHADRDMIGQVLINLVKNAIQSFDDHTHRLIELKGYYGEKARPVISVKDNGNGIDEEAMEKIFIPFFTTKKQGSGIGLSLSRQIMRKHQGVLGVKSRADEGTEFVLKF